MTSVQNQMVMQGNGKMMGNGIFDTLKSVHSKLKEWKPASAILNSSIGQAALSVVPYGSTIKKGYGPGSNMGGKKAYGKKKKGSKKSKK